MVVSAKWQRWVESFYSFEAPSITFDSWPSASIFIESTGESLLSYANSFMSENFEKTKATCCIHSLKCRIYYSQ